MRKRKPIEVFSKLGIDASKPGFDGDPKFLAAEKSNPELLDQYAEYVRDLAYPQEYLDRVRPTILRLSQFMFDRLREDGRRGACVDVSIALSRMLDKLGIWNHAVKGSLTTTLEPSIGAPPRHLRAFLSPGSKAVAGHVWVYAPPFQILDVTAALQEDDFDLFPYLPPVVAAESVNPAKATLDDMMDGNMIRSLRQHIGREPTIGDADKLSPGLLRRMQKYGVGEVSFDKGTHKFVAAASGASDVPLEKITSLSLSGKHPQELFAEFQAIKS